MTFSETVRAAYPPPNGPPPLPPPAMPPSTCCRKFSSLPAVGVVRLTKSNDLAVLEAVVGDAGDRVVVVEIDGEDALADHLLGHEGDRLLAGLADVVERLAAEILGGRGRAERDQHLVLARPDRHLLDGIFGHDIAVLGLDADAAGGAQRQRTRGQPPSGIAARRPRIILNPLPILAFPLACATSAGKTTKAQDRGTPATHVCPLPTRTPRRRHTIHPLRRDRGAGPNPRPIHRSRRSRHRRGAIRDGCRAYRRWCSAASAAATRRRRRSGRGSSTSSATRWTMRCANSASRTPRSGKRMRKLAEAYYGRAAAYDERARRGRRGRRSRQRSGAPSMAARGEWRRRRWLPICWPRTGRSRRRRSIASSPATSPGRRRSLLPGPAENQP